MNKELIIKHLNNLRFKLGQEKDLLLKMKEKPTNDLHQAEIDLNINYYDQEIKEIDEIVRNLETNNL
jgi:hypothetical protein